MDEHTSHEQAYKNGYEKGYNKGYVDALKYAMSVVDDIKRNVEAISKKCEGYAAAGNAKPHAAERRMRHE